MKDLFRLTGICFFASATALILFCLRKLLPKRISLESVGEVAQKAAERAELPYWFSKIMNAAFEVGKKTVLAEPEIEEPEPVESDAFDGDLTVTRGFSADAETD